MMSIKDWGIKFYPRQVVAIEIRPGEVVSVEIEGVSVRGDSVIYDVREVESRMGYPAS
jgi:hypothetical protein